MSDELPSDKPSGCSTGLCAVVVFLVILGALAYEKLHLGPEALGNMHACAMELAIALLRVVKPEIFQ